MIVLINGGCNWLEKHVNVYKYKYFVALSVNRCTQESAMVSVSSYTILVESKALFG